MRFESTLNVYFFQGQSKLYEPFYLAYAPLRSLIDDRRTNLSEKEIQQREETYFKQGRNYQ